MKKQIKKSVKWLKKQDVNGCITGSCLLDYFENQDVDLFVYDEKSFSKVLFAMHHNKNFQILDPIEQWKFDQYVNKADDGFFKRGLITIKFVYNTCVDINIILKKRCKDIFSVLSSFDLDIICKGYDLKTKQYLDLSPKDKSIASWNKWNTSYYSEEIWKMSRILRQLDRCFKYHKRGYNTDNAVKKYLDIIEKLINFNNIFDSKGFEERLETTKSNMFVVKKIAETWLETHEISEKERELLMVKLKEL